MQTIAIAILRIRKIHTGFSTRPQRCRQCPPRASHRRPGHPERMAGLHPTADKKSRPPPLPRPNSPLSREDQAIRYARVTAYKRWKRKSGWKGKPRQSGASRVTGRSGRRTSRGAYSSLIVARSSLAFVYSCKDPSYSCTCLFPISSCRMNHPPDARCPLLQ